MLNDLRTIGVGAGDLLIVHSSFRSLGLTGRTPADVIRTLLESLGSEGTLMMPTFTYCYSGIWGVKPFNPETTPSVFMGVLPETLRSCSGARRSASPTYSVAAFGRHAELLTKGKENAGGLGPGSSFEDAYRLGARILLLGVGNNRNSMIHYAEYASGLPVCDIPYRAFWGSSALVERGGEAVEVPLKPDFPGCSANFGAADEFLVEHNLRTRGSICAASACLLDAQPMVDAIAEQLRKTPDWLFCESISCEPCTLRRARLRSLGLL